jgi:hypothetical protein
MHGDLPAGDTTLNPGSPDGRTISVVSDNAPLCLGFRRLCLDPLAESRLVVI